MNILRRFAVFLLLCCALSMIISEAKRDRERKRMGRKKTGKSGRTKDMNKFYVCPLSCENTKRKPCFDSEPREKTAESITRGDVENSLNSTRSLLDDLLASLDVVTSNMSNNGLDDLFPRISIKELFPVENKIRLASDGQFKLLGQMTWWLSWIGASFEIMQEVSKRVAGRQEPMAQPLVPSVRDSNNYVHSLSSLIHGLRKLQSSVGVLRTQVGFKEEGKKGRQKRLSKCQKVKVVHACSDDSGCSEDRDRAYVILRDASHAVRRMQEALEQESCKVEDSRKTRSGFSLGKCQDQSVFYRLQCVRKACVLQKTECKQCLSRDYL